MRALDKNQLSDKELFASSQDLFLVPDIAWFEDIKSNGWRDDIRRSFVLFQKEPNRLHIAYGVPDLLKRELQTRSPITDPINWESTRSYRELLKQDDYVSAIEANVESLRQAGLGPVVHLADNRQTLSDGMAALAKLSGPDVMSKLRSYQAVSQPRLTEFAPHIAVLADSTLKHTLSELGLPGAEGSALASRQSAFYRVQFCYWAQVLQFAMCSPSLQTGDHKLLNDIVDSDYAITASYCEALETKEDRLRQRYDALVSALRSES